MTELVRVDWLDPRAVRLREAMDVEMTTLYASRSLGATDEESALVQRALETHADEMFVSILAVDGDEAVGHTALRAFGDGLEVKKVFVSPSHRGRGISKLLMQEVETIARERGVTSLVLQTGDRQTEAIALYLRMGYREVPVFAPYDAIPFALCFSKTISETTA